MIIRRNVRLSQPQIRLLSKLNECGLIYRSADGASFVDGDGERVALAAVVSALLNRGALEWLAEAQGWQLSSTGFELVKAIGGSPRNSGNVSFEDGQPNLVNEEVDSAAVDDLQPIFMLYG